MIHLHNRRLETRIDEPIQPILPGEQTLEVPVVLDVDRAVRLADQDRVVH